MLLSSPPELLKVGKRRKIAIYSESRFPEARNPIYQKPINFGCYYCINKSGRRKHFKNLYHLYRHFTEHHPNEPRYKEITMELADLILNRTLL